jgi:hypothetical protein
VICASRPALGALSTTRLKNKIPKRTISKLPCLLIAASCKLQSDIISGPLSKAIHMRRRLITVRQANCFALTTHLGVDRVDFLGRTRDWLKFKNPAAPAVKREAEEDWGRRGR